MTVARDTILAMHRSVGSGGPNFTPDVAARAWNDALVAVVVRLELDSEENALAALKRMVDAERARRQVYLDEFNARERAAKAGRCGCPDSVGPSAPVGEFCDDCHGLVRPASETAGIAPRQPAVPDTRKEP